jgi:hypothetical protein
LPMLVENLTFSGRADSSRRSWRMKVVKSGHGHGGLLRLSRGACPVVASVSVGGCLAFSTVLGESHFSESQGSMIVNSLAIE